MVLYNSSAYFDFKDTLFASNHFKSFINYVDYQCKVHPDKQFISYGIQNGFKSLTYAQLDLISTNLACKWFEATKEVTVASFISDHNVNYLIVMLALMKLRVTLMTISPRNSEPAIINLLEKTQSELLITTTKYQLVSYVSASKVAAHTKVIVIDTAFDIETLLLEPLNPDHTTLLDTEFSDEDIEKCTLIIHSSGSTAFPKPIQLSNRYLFNVVNFFHVINSKGGSIKINQDDVFLSCAPLFHVFGFFAAFNSLSFGAKVVFLEKLPASQKEIDQALEYNKCTAMCATSLVYEQMIPYLKEKIDFSNVRRLKFAIYGGAPLKLEVGQWLLDHGLNIRNSYGTTETTAVLASDFYSTTSNNWYSLTPYRDHNSTASSDCVFEIEDINEPEIKHLYIRAGSPGLALGISNRPDGGYSTNDLFKENPDYPGYYIYMGRRDDILIMENGEKTNPTPMESTLRMHPIIKQAAVLGHGRQCTCVLIEINMEYAIRFSPEEIISEVYKAVKDVNKECPSHSTILSQMVKILPLDQTLPFTDKGNVMRKKAEVLYLDVIEKLYKDFLEGPVTTNKEFDQGSDDTSTWTEKQIEDFLVNCAAKVLNLSESTFNNRSKSLFDYGLTSLTSIQLRNYIAERFDHIPQNFIYQNSSIAAMRKSFMSTIEEDPDVLIEKRYEETQQLALHYINQANLDFPVAATNTYDNKQDNKVILLTGVTGSLGSFILQELLLDPSVKKVYAMVRGGNHPDELMKRLVKSFESRFLDTSLLLKKDRVEVLPMRLDEPFLGFGSDEKYFELKKEVTIVQHCAWLLDFNLTIDHYDKECIAPFYNLVKFAYRKVNPMHIHFISSVSASARYGNLIPEEFLPLDSHLAMPLGYSQSKFVVESLFNYLISQKNFPCYIERLGQVCGDSINGIWNISEQYPLMFIGGGAMMHKMPGLNIPIDWITVDSAAATIVDIMMRTAYLPATKNKSVYHIVNPNTIIWNDVLEAMKDNGMTFDVVTSSNWVDLLAKNDTNPAYKLMSFYETNFRDDFMMPIWETKKTCALSPLLSKSPILDASLFRKFLTHWSSVGFYNPNT